MIDYRKLYTYQQFLAARTAGNVQTETLVLDELAGKVVRDGLATTLESARAYVVERETTIERGPVVATDVEITRDGRYAIVVSHALAAYVSPIPGSNQFWVRFPDESRQFRGNKSDALRVAIESVTS